MAINLTQIKDLLMPGLKGITGKYDMIPTQWSKVFDQTTSDKALERYVETRLFGLAQLKTEGGAIASDNGAGQRYVYNQEHNDIALLFSITQKAIEDNLYKQQFSMSASALMDSFKQTKEIYGANILNNATVVNGAIGGDGVALCSTAHPIDGATYANRPTVDVDLNESTLLSAAINIRTNFKNAAGLKIMARADKLIVPPTLAPIAERLLRSELRPGTSDNDVNVVGSVGGVREYIIMDFLTSNFAWFLKTNIPGLQYMKRVGYSTDMHTDFVTNNLLVKGRERYSFSYHDPRSLYGSFPTS